MEAILDELIPKFSAIFYDNKKGQPIPNLNINVKIDVWAKIIILLE